MKKIYQKPEVEFVALGMADAITEGNDTDVGYVSNPFLQAVLEDEAAMEGEN